MAEPTTAAEVDVFRRKYFLALDSNGLEIEWPTDTKSTAVGGQGYKAKVGTLSQPLQDDLTDLLDALVTAL